MNGHYEWLLAAAKTVGIPALVAGYFMLRDYLFMAESIRLQTTMVELLRQLTAK